MIFLHGCEFELAVINLVQTAAMRKTGIRKTQTDKVYFLPTMFFLLWLVVGSVGGYAFLKGTNEKQNQNHFELMARIIEMDLYPYCSCVNWSFI